MRLYICIDGSFAGTQADAKAKGKGFTEVDVPTDKAGLIDYLNGMVDEQRDQRASETPEEAPPARETATRAAPLPEGYRTTETGAVVEFILDRATIGQVETIFSALGSRFADARRAA